MPTASAGASLREWLRPPRHLLVLFLGTTLSFWAGLGWLGWRTFEQERELEHERVRIRREGATTALAADIRRNLDDVETQLERFADLPAGELTDALTAYALLLTEDALIGLLEDDGVRAFPRHRLLFHPGQPAAGRVSVNLLPARAYSQLATDPTGAIEIFAAFARSDDTRIRAGALLGLAQAQAKAGRTADALATYARLDQPDVLVHGRPAELLARSGRCALLAALGRTAELADEAGRFLRDLQRGRWQLTRATYFFYVEEARDLLRQAGISPDDEPGGRAAIALADAVSDLWSQRDEPRPAAGRASRDVNGLPVVILWRETEARRLALIAGPRFVEERLLGSLRTVADQQHLQIVLEDGEGRDVLSYGTAAPEAESSRLTAAEAQLPWTVRVAGNPASDLAQSTGGRQLVAAGLAFLALFVAAGSYFSMRAISREIEAARLKSDFVAAVSHEFRTPLTLLRQFSDLLAEDRVSGELERQRYYAALQRGTRRLTRLVEDLLDFGRMEAGSRAFALQPIRARDWLEALTREFQEEVRNRGYTIDLLWEAPDGVVVEADEAALGRALWNLLDNAVKYSPGCATVWVTGRLEDDRLVVRVRDRGLGVSRHEQRAIFRKFVRGSSSSGSGIKGTGLGLAMVEQIVEAHGGEVHLDSTVGEGSTFDMRLPARIEAREQAQEQPAWRAS